MAVNGAVQRGLEGGEHCSNLLGTMPFLDSYYSSIAPVEEEDSPTPPFVGRVLNVP